MCTLEIDGVKHTISIPTLNLNKNETEQLTFYETQWNDLMLFPHDEFNLEFDSKQNPKKPEFSNYDLITIKGTNGNYLAYGCLNDHESKWYQLDMVCCSSVCRRPGVCRCPKKLDEYRPGNKISAKVNNYNDITLYYSGNIIAFI